MALFSRPLAFSSWLFAGTCLTGACKLTMIGGEIVWKEDTL